MVVNKHKLQLGYDVIEMVVFCIRCFGDCLMKFS